MKPPARLLAIAVPAAVIGVLLGAHARPAAAQVTPPPAEAAPTPGARWSLALLGGALVPVRAMRDDYQEGLVAGLRLGVRARLGIGVQLAVDYSPLPRRATGATTFDTTYGTVGVIPGWTFGRGTVRLQVGVGGGVALERTQRSGGVGDVESAYAAAALAQAALEIHVSNGGGLVLMTGATRTFGDRTYEYAWAMGGLTLEF